MTPTQAILAHLKTRGVRYKRAAAALLGHAGNTVAQREER